MQTVAMTELSTSPSGSRDHMNCKVYLVVQKHLVQKVKQALDDRELLDHAEKIRSSSTGSFYAPLKQLSQDGCSVEERAQLTRALILDDLQLREHSDAVTYCVERTVSLGNPRCLRSSHHNILAEAMQKWLHGVDLALLQKANVAAEALLANCPTISAIYPPMLLLSKDAFSSEAWISFICDDSSSTMRHLYRDIALRFGVTHIAKLGPIPVQDGKTGASRAAPNVLRSPTQLKPLYGDFGEYTPHPANPNALPEALWVTVKQNGIHQCWAPLYTMFSQGNVKEKQRLLKMLLQEQDSIIPAESAAVDLYAGIGYFSFCYAKAGFKEVLCWELNPWSVEGLRRGAAKNNWRVSPPFNPGETGLPEKRDFPMLQSEETLVVFHEDNVHAARRIEALRKDLPPVRHVNCGLLPSSEAVWRPALEILDSHLGGWVHVHENINDRGRDKKVREITDIFNHEAAPRRVGRVELHKVKSYAPGTTHWVLDVEILPT